MIVRSKVPRGIIVTIVNYDKYQTPKNYEGAYERWLKMSARRIDDTIMVQ